MKTKLLISGGLLFSFLGGFWITQLVFRILLD